MRALRLAFAASLASLASLAAGGLAEARPLLPDLVQKAPYKVSVVERHGRHLLAFASATENVGEGALAIAGRRAGARPVMEARQIIRRTDGPSRVRPLGPLLAFHALNGHEHWHLTRFARYSLRAEGEPAGVRARKAGFCLGDRYRSGLVASVPQRWHHQCGLGRPDLTRIRQGISVGWGDAYAPGVHGQWVSLRGVRAGRYVLVHRANPGGFLRESDDENNASSVLLELTRPQGERPRVRVLASCPGAATCSDR
jgi:hypothetical protein